MRNKHFATLAAVLAASGATAAQAAIVITDKAAYTSSAGVENESGPIPIVAGSFGSRMVGDVTISAGAGSSLNLTQDWSSRIAGNQWAINGVENFSIDFDGPKFSFGIDLVEPERDPLVNAAFIDSTFRIDLCNGMTCFDSVSFSPMNDMAVFLAVASMQAFDRVVFTETTGGIENEFFGEIFASTRPIPLPGAALLFAPALAGLAFVRRRR
ncbi:hypothetical protein [Parvularcula lutaonensis]|uniref:PEP-CTERM protein-sorting domain-containing protein n=1 Tax=Parvularcula lutaonensis TaxID=491923 RepID=A0ABV7M9Q5_9PROT|nr:hypothetical protein [Parvularcula lutaonensis]GGY47687.1 hypothetical protein GCM10007148_16370 [Parvularcula lutaonensis]